MAEFLRIARLRSDLCNSYKKNGVPSQILATRSKSKLSLSHESDNAFGVFSIKHAVQKENSCPFTNGIVSRITKFLMDRGARLTATLRTTYYRRSSLMQGVLEIPCSVDVYMMGTAVLSRRLIQRYTELVLNFYMEPPDDGCVGSFVETPVASVDFNITSTSKGKSRRNDPMRKIRKSKKKEKMLS